MNQTEFLFQVRNFQFLFHLLCSNLIQIEQNFTWKLNFTWKSVSFQQTFNNWKQNNTTNTLLQIFKLFCQPDNCMMLFQLWIFILKLKFGRERCKLVSWNFHSLAKTYILSFLDQLPIFFTTSPKKQNKTIIFE